MKNKSRTSRGVNSHLYVVLFKDTVGNWHRLIRAGVHRFFFFRKKFRNRIKIPGSRKMTLSTFHTGAPQIMGDSVQTLVATETWRVGFVHL